MTYKLPSSNSAIESAIINAPTSHVWQFLRLKDFSKFFKGIIKSESIHSADTDANIVRWTFEGGNWLDVKLEEYSTIKHYIAFNIINSQYKLSYTSVLSTIRLWPITSGSAEGGTFVEWCGHYSSDADAGVIEDGKIKRREALSYLAKVAEQI